MKKILSAEMVMDDHGEYRATVVDYLNNMTYEDKVPDHIVSMIPMLFAQLQRKSS